jgi:hypothetical protein
VGWPPAGLRQKGSARERASTTGPPRCRRRPLENICLVSVTRPRTDVHATIVRRRTCQEQKKTLARAARMQCMDVAMFFVDASPPFDSVAPNTWHGPSLTWRLKGFKSSERGRVELAVLDSVVSLRTAWMEAWSTLEWLGVMCTGLEARPSGAFVCFYSST